MDVQVGGQVEILEKVQGEQKGREEYCEGEREERRNEGRRYGWEGG